MIYVFYTFVCIFGQLEGHLHVLYVRVHHLHSALLVHHCNCNLTDEILFPQKPQIIQEYRGLAFHFCRKTFASKTENNTRVYGRRTTRLADSLYGESTLLNHSQICRGLDKTMACSLSAPLLLWPIHKTA